MLRDTFPTFGVEPLEGRTLMSGVGPAGSTVVDAAAAAAASYNLYNLMFTTKRGASWAYAGDYQVTGDMTSSGHGPATVGVLSKQKAYGGQNCNVVYTNSNFLNGRLAFYQARDGVHAAAVVADVGVGKLTANLRGAVVAPPSLKVGGKAWSDTGTVDGSFDLGSVGLGGSLTGKATVTSRLLKTQRITVPAGTFNTVKGTMTIALNGTLKISAQGQTVKLNFGGTIAETFWATNKVGVVKFNTTDAVTASYAGEKIGITVTTHASLTSRKVPTARTAPATATPAPAFWSTRRITDEGTVVDDGAAVYA
jgi:hypothetical protein